VRASLGLGIVPSLLVHETKLAVPFSHYRFPPTRTLDQDNFSAYYVYPFSMDNLTWNHHPPAAVSRPHVYRRHFDCFLFASACSNPFSRSSGRMRGVGGTSSKAAFWRDLDCGSGSLSSLGNSDRRGVRAATTLRADLRRFSRILHSFFLVR
jgi:hypothetical protein